jgi:hypothetical protein
MWRVRRRKAPKKPAPSQDRDTTVLRGVLLSALDGGEESLPPEVLSAASSGTPTGSGARLPGFASVPGNAVQAGDVSVIRDWLDAGGDLDNARGGEFDDTLLSVASAHGHAQIVQLCLAARADVSATASDGVTALHRACAYARTDIVCQLLGANADVNGESSDGATPLHEACSGGPGWRLPSGSGAVGQPLPPPERDVQHLRIVELLLAADALINASVRSSNTTPLHYAAAKGRTAIAVQLLEHGADPEARSFLCGGSRVQQRGELRPIRIGLTPLECAERRGQLDTARAICLSLEAGEAGGMVRGPSHGRPGGRLGLQRSATSRRPSVSVVATQALDWMCTIS